MCCTRQVLSGEAAAAVGTWRRRQARETAPFQCSPVEASLVLLLQFFGERQEESGLNCEANATVVIK